MSTAVAVVAASTVTGTQNITTTDLAGDTPVAVLFLYARAAGSGVVRNDSAVSTGATDGVNQVAHAYFYAGGSSYLTPTNCNTARTDCCLIHLSAGNVVHSKASVVGFIPNGVTVNWTVAGADGFVVTALFFAGADWMAQVGTNGIAELPSQAAKVTLGWEPNLVFAFNAGSFITDNTIVAGACKHTWGWCIKHGTGVSGSALQGEWNRYEGSIQLPSAAGFYWAIGSEYLLQIGLVADGFFFQTTLVPGAHIWGYLALRYSGVGNLTQGQITLTQTTTGPCSVTGFGGEPSGFLVLQTQESTGAATTIESFGNIAISPLFGGGFKTGGFASAGGTMSGAYIPISPLFGTEVACNDTIYMLAYTGTDHGNINFQATMTSFDADGFTMDLALPPFYIPSNRVLAKYIWNYLTIVNGPGPPPPPPPPAPVHPGGYIIERFDNRVWPTVENCWCVDCGFTLARPTPDADLTIGSAYGAGILINVTNLIGGSGYSAATTATVVDANGLGPGTGAVADLTIVGGAITAVIFSSAGSGYVYPALVINDPENTGSGASATVVMDNSSAILASAPVFSIGDIGSVIRAGYGVMVITAVTDSQNAIVTMRSPVVQIQPDDPISPNQVIKQLSGTWTMTMPITQLYLPQLVGFEITGLADGQIIPPIVVPDDGLVTLAVPASAIIVGLAFTSQLQSTYLDSGEPTIQGSRKKIAEVTVRIEQSAAFQVGGNQPDGSVQSPQQLAPQWQNMVDAPTHAVAPFNSQAIPLFTGDVRIPIPSGYNTKGQVAVQQLNPLPLQVLDYVPEVLGGDTPSQKAPERKGKGQEQ